MVRFVIIGIVIAVAFTLYALVDAAMTDASRARGVSKPIWIVLIVVLPIIGAALWFLIGKGSPQSQGRSGQQRRSAPDDDPRFTGTRLSSTDLDAHMRDLEDRLRELDNETFPGEDAHSGETSGEVADRPAQASRPSAAQSPVTERPTDETIPPVDADASSEGGADSGTKPSPDARDARSGETGKRPDGDTAS